MTRNPIFSGVYAALLTPRGDSGEILWPVFEENAAFLLNAGVDGLCVNGATGEYPMATDEERVEAARRARALAGSTALVFSAIGGASLDQVKELGAQAQDAGCDGVLIPGPHFFKYATSDLAAFYRSAASGLRIPALLYNLPSFTAGIEHDLAVDLITTTPQIAGIKDSSGKLDILDTLSGPAHKDAVRFVGNDNALAEAVERKICDGTISGIAGVLPELTLALCNQLETLVPEEFATASRLLDELLSQLEPFPIPWGLKLIAEARGWTKPRFALPLSVERAAQAEAFLAWFAPWWEKAEADLLSTLRPV